MKEIVILLEAEENQSENSGDTPKFLLIARLSLIETNTFNNNMK